MNICITGALGHIGSYLIRNLRGEEVDKIYLIDNFWTQRYASLFDLPQRRKFIFKECDILSKDLERIISEVDVVIHLAAITDAESSFSKEEQVVWVNEEGLRVVAELCCKHSVKLVFPSTTSVYGTQKSLVDEDCPPDQLKPQSPYADSKLKGERVLEELGKSSGLDFVILRLGTVFGFSVGMRFHTAVNRFIWQAVHGQELAVWCTAYEQFRPYLGLQDCTNAISGFIADSRFDGEVYNIVTTNLTVRDIVDIIRKFIPSTEVGFVDSPIMNQLSYKVSHEKSKAAGVKYQDVLEEGIRQTIECLKNSHYSPFKHSEVQS